MPEAAFPFRPPVPVVDEAELQALKEARSPLSSGDEKVREVETLSPLSSAPGRECRNVGILLFQGHFCGDCEVSELCLLRKARLRSKPV